jgi:hypothetical protein
MAAFLMTFSGLLWNGAENAAIALKILLWKEPGLQKLSVH